MEDSLKEKTKEELLELIKDKKKKACEIARLYYKSNKKPSTICGCGGKYTSEQAKNSHEKTIRHKKHIEDEFNKIQEEKKDETIKDIISE